MTIHIVRLDIITTIEQHRRDTITIITTEHLRRRDTIRIMAIAINLTISIDLIAINRSVIMGHLIMGHLTSVARLLTEVVDKKYNEIKKIIIIS